MLEDGLDGGFSEVGRVPVLAEDVLDQNPHSGAGRLAVLNHAADRVALALERKLRE